MSGNRLIDAALRRYWDACSAEEEREAYVLLLAAGGVASYGESEEEVDRLLVRYGLERSGPHRKLDVLSVTRDVARGG